MQTHQTGPIFGTRLGAVVVAQSAVIDFVGKAIGNNDLKLLTIDATPQNPVAMRLSTIIRNQFVNGANAVTLSLGSAQGGTQFQNILDLKSASGTFFATANIIIVFTTRTEIWSRLTNTTTAATAGVVDIITELFDINNTTPTTQGG